jgi:nucleoside-diphosphate-sugar epimerase
VIGATGGVGGAVARALAASGWQVRAAHRAPERAAAAWGKPDSIEWVGADAMDEAAVVAAAEGCDILFHGANPPRYLNWRDLALPMLRNAIAAARLSGARLIFPGNVYNYGPDAWPLVEEPSPQHPISHKGAVRVEMERLLADAAAGGVRSLVVRAGDFLGDTPSSWFRAVMVRPGRPVNYTIYPGDRRVGHAWAYLPDFAGAVLRLAEIERTLPAFTAVNFGGHWIAPGDGILEAVRRIVDRPLLPILPFPWLIAQLAGPFVPVLGELLEMRYLWRVPLRLDNTKLLALIGEEPHTPLDEAVRETLRAIGCLPAR